MIHIATTPAAPKKCIRVLLLEDNATDAELVLRALRRAGFEPEWQRVEDEPTFLSRLDQATDIILADYHLPQFDALQALRRLQERKLDIPFIIISGTLGDELAAQCIKQGVTDYLLKDRLDRLGLAVSNALDERRLREERLLVEEQLRQAQKMEAIGQLAGGISHDFNNVLTVINGWSCLMLEDPTVSPATREAAKQIFTAGQRAGSLTRQLLYFSRKRPIQRVALDLNATIDEVGSMLRRLIGENIVFEMELAQPLPLIEADATMMEQVLVNLTVNARDAMPDGGRLTIRTEAVQLTGADIRGKSEATPGHFVRLQVQDTGTGIPPEVLPRIFEPFFTTKAEGEGTGLGLATIFGILKQHHGWIDVVTGVSEGTTFSAYLPVTNLPVGATLQPFQESTIVHGGRETLLIVEDENSVREYAVAVLQPLGYRVLQAASGVDALEVWKWHSARIDLLLTDMVMPDEITGPELAARLRAEKPNLGVIFTSGYSQEAMTEVFAADGNGRFVHKPYSPRQLSRMIREVLDQRIAAMAANAAPTA